MNILIIGSGGREHALAYTFAKSPQLTQLYVAPGNPGTFQCAQNVPIAADNIAALLEFAHTHAIDITFVGPEQPLALGIVDAFHAKGLAIIGPSREAAQLESSKAWAKQKYAAYGIPTADYRVCEDYTSALAYIQQKNQFPIVIKADGLAAGKGVTVAQTLSDAQAALQACFIDKVFSGAGHRVVIEDFLEGEEASLLAFTDGVTLKPMIAAQDHKAIYDGDTGPNTGGMGAYAPAPIVTPAVHEAIMTRIFTPLIEGFRRDGIVYKGILYAGLMIDRAGNPYVVEFNVRFGDPETQVVLPALQTDLITICQAIIQGRLADCPVEWDDQARACVVMASAGYPGAYATGDAIQGLNDAADDTSFIFHSGTSLSESGTYHTNGGRVLSVCAQGDTLQSAITSVYNRVKRVSFSGAYYRRDIGQKGLAATMP